MAVTHYTLTATFTDLLGAAYSPTSSAVVAWIETNVADTEGIVDDVSDLIALGPQRQTADSAGLVTFANLIGSDSAEADINIAAGTLQYRVTAEYVNAQTRKRGQRWSSGWFSLTANTNLADVVAEQYIPATYISQATAELDDYVAGLETTLDDYVTDAETAKTGAEDARDLAEQYRDEAHDISMIDTSDGVVEALINDSGSDTAAALTASYGQAINVHADVTHGIGSGDDTAFLQAALDRVAPAIGLNTVVINAGTWMIDAVNEAQSPVQNRWIGAGIKPKAGTTLVLAEGATIKVTANANPGYAAIYLGSDQNNVTIRGGAILGDRATHTYATGTGADTHEFGYGIAIRGATGVLIEGVEVTGCTGDSIFVAPQGLIGLSTYYPAEATIRRCTLDGARRNNISILGDSKVTVEDNYITNAGTNDGAHDGTAPRAGIDCEGYGVGETDYEIPQNITIRGNTFVGNVSSSVTNYNGYGVLVDGNFCDSPINLGFGRDTIIRGNVLINLTDTTNPAITSNASGTYAAHSTIEGNIIRGFDTGIKVQRDNVLISNNYIWGFDAFGIDIGNCTQITVQSNRVTDGSTNAAVGIRILTATAVRVIANELYNVGTGISFVNTSTGISIRNNAITKANLGIGIAAACEVLVKGNTTNLPGHAAGQSYDVQWASTSQVVCEGNTFRNSSTYSINCTSGGTNGVSRILRNQIIGNTSGAAISCTSGAHEIIDNEIIHNRASAVTSAILLASASGSRIMGNTIYNVGAGAVTGIVTSSSSSTKIARNIIQGGGTPITPASTDTLSDNTAVGDEVISKSATYTAKVTDRTIRVTAGASGFTLTLPTAAIAGIQYVIKRIDAGAGTVTVATTSSQTIDGATTKTLTTQYDRLIVVSDGTGWNILG